MDAEILTAWLMGVSSVLVLLAGILTVLHQHRRDEAAKVRARRVHEIQQSQRIAAGFAAGWHGGGRR